MVPTAQQVRTTLLLACAGAVLGTAWALSQRTAGCPEPSDDGLVVVAKTTSASILRGEEHVAITVHAPGGLTHARPPLSVAVVIDRSGSMSGTPIANAKAAAAKLVDALDDTDAFTVVTYSSGDETVVPMSRATAANKQAAHAAIDRIWDDGGTCISCGLTRGAAELGRTPVVGGLRRIVLISDGQANEGISDRNQLAQLASDTAVSGVSISTVGVGLDFDELTMQRLADVGHGNYYFVEDTRTLDAMFQRELGNLGETVAADVRLAIRAGTGVRIDEAYGYPITREGDRVIVPIADLRAGETRKVVLRVQVSAGTGALDVVAIDAAWRRVADGAARLTRAHATAEVTDDMTAVKASIDPDALGAIREAQSAHVLEQAATVYETQGYRAAQQVIQRNLDAVRADPKMPAKTRAVLEQASDELLDGLATAPATKATKATRAKAYQLAR